MSKSSVISSVYIRDQKLSDALIECARRNRRAIDYEILERIEKSLFLDAFKFLRLNHDKKLTHDFAVTDLEQKLIELFRLINDQKQAAVIEFLSDLSIEAGKIGNWWLDDGS